MSQTVRVQVMFEQSTKYGTFRDALYYDPIVFQNTKQADIDAEVQLRVDAYVKSIENPPTPPTPTKEELQAQLQEVQDSKNEIVNNLDTKAAEIQAAIDASAAIAVDPDPIVVVP